MLKKIANVAVATLLVGGLGFGMVQSASAAPVKPKQIGACANKTTGALRMLEVKRPAKSQYGKCRVSERQVPLPTVDGVPKPVGPAAVVVYRRVTGTETCTRTADVVLTYACVTAPVPTATPTPTGTS